MITNVSLPKLLPYQKKLSDAFNQDGIDTVMFLKSRQSGGTWFNKWLCCKLLLSCKNIRVGYTTPTNKLGRSIHKELCNSLKDYITSQNSVELFIEVSSGSTIQFFSAESRDSVRGFQFDYLIIDEAAFQPDDFFYYVLKPTMLVRGKKTLMCSTPNTANGFFHKLCEMSTDSKNIELIKITINDNPFVTAQDIAEIKKLVPDRVFRQEYLSEFLDDDGSVFSNFRDCINRICWTKGKN